MATEFSKIERYVAANSDAVGTMGDVIVFATALQLELRTLRMQEGLSEKDEKCLAFGAVALLNDHLAKIDTLDPFSVEMGRTFMPDNAAQDGLLDLRGEHVIMGHFDEFVYQHRLRNCATYAIRASGTSMIEHASNLPGDYTDGSELILPVMAIGAIYAKAA
jgi:hypothetical protein